MPRPKSAMASSEGVLSAPGVTISFLPSFASSTYVANVKLSLPPSPALIEWAPGLSPEWACPGCVDGAETGLGEGLGGAAVVEDVRGFSHCEGLPLAGEGLLCPIGQWLMM